MIPIGGIEFISKTELEKYGYQDFIPNHVTLEYVQDNDFNRIQIQTENSKLSLATATSYWLDGADYSLIWDYLIKQRFSLDKTKEDYPELFL